MKKFFILILAFPLLAASCDITGGLFDIGSGVRGVFRSEDGADSFHTANKLTTKGDISSASINSLAFDPQNPDIIYAAAAGGIYKSDNGAGSWHYILSGIAGSDIATDPVNKDVVYASGLAQTNGKIIKSLDAGTSWVDVYSEPSKNNSVTTVAVARGNSSVILAGLASGEIIRSFDAGHTWQSTKAFGDKIMRVRFGPSGTAYALTLHNGVYKSPDLGVTWTQTSTTLTTSSISSSNSGTVTASAFYDLALDRRQAGVVYLGSQQGVFRTVNDGKDWAFLKLPLKDASLRASAVAVDPNNSNILYVAVASTIFKSLNGAVTWETKILPTSSEVHTILINPQSSNVLYLGLGTKR